MFGCPHLDLFATRANVKPPLYVSPVPDPIARKQDAFQHSWAHLSTYAFPPFVLIRQVLSRVLLSIGLSLILLALCWPQKEWFADLLSLLVDEPFKLLQVWNLLVQPHVREFHCSLGTLCLHVWKLSSDLSEKQGFLGLAKAAAADLRSSTTALYQSKWFRFFHWCRRRDITLCKASVQQVTEFFLYLCRDLRLSVPVVKGY